MMEAENTNDLDTAIKSQQVENALCTPNGKQYGFTIILSLFRIIVLFLLLTIFSLR